MNNILINCILFVLVAAAGNAKEDKSADVNVSVSTIKVKMGGDLIISLYDSKDSWLNLDKALVVKTVPADSDTIVVKFENIAPGKYAVSVIHDKNQDGKMNMRIFPFPKPKEGAGVSNNGRRMGKPKFDKALFDVTEQGKSIQIDLFY